MDHFETNEIIEYMNRKYAENVPRVIRFAVRKKAKMIEKFELDEMPSSLRNCTLEQFIIIIKDALR